MTLRGLVEPSTLYRIPWLQYFWKSVFLSQHRNLVSCCELWRSIVNWPIFKMLISIYCCLVVLHIDRIKDIVEACMSWTFFLAKWLSYINWRLCNKTKRYSTVVKSYPDYEKNIYMPGFHRLKELSTSVKLSNKSTYWFITYYVNNYLETSLHGSIYNFIILEIIHSYKYMHNFAYV